MSTNSKSRIRFTTLVSMSQACFGAKMLDPTIESEPTGFGGAAETLGRGDW